MGRAVRLPDYDVRMEPRLAIFLHDISRERQDLYLFIDRDLPLVFAAGIKKS